MSNKRIAINPALLTWARERAGLDQFDLAHRFPKLAEWESGEAQPTLNLDSSVDRSSALELSHGYKR